jgi:hypothetical protein
MNKLEKRVARQTITALGATMLQIKGAFEEGFSSYETVCCSMNSVDEAWNNSGAKAVYDAIKAQRDAVRVELGEGV